MRNSAKLALAVGLCGLTLASCIVIPPPPPDLSVAPPPQQDQSGGAPRQTHAADLTVEATSQGAVANAPEAFSGNDIELPRAFDTAALESCGTDRDPLQCPFRQKIVQIYFQDVRADISGGDAEAASSVMSVDNILMSEWLADFLSRTGRFDIRTRDDNLLIAVEGTVEAQGDAATQAYWARKQFTAPDIVLRVSARKSASFVYRGVYGEATYGINLSGAFIDPATQRMLSTPRVKDIQVHSDPEKYWIVNGQYVNGFNIADRGSVAALYEQLANQAFRLIVNAVMNYNPSGGRIVSLHGDRFELDRGATLGVQSNETMIVFVDDNGITEPIAVARVEAGVERSSGVISNWKTTSVAEAIRSAARTSPIDGRQYHLYAVSVGAPEGYAY
jgi:hypothetical protein